ncbi:PAS domain-containing protein [Paenibacillus crassostreae]|uniref:PAS fold-4 domain-containing protein n=1 Tax=Paenibacillus crassostreae TaxID=1763538 RepID=A0A167GL22_9BACL|nr:PAS domain-containing protein [Paenibacillus crassostreae]AOZ92212.1 hypothetical protein LPB68_08205 [Paenibacillus crassostreae]OAB77674.1 hypothetical protein PNBC_01285 [Paenibacillus crassostreae]
MPAVLPNEVLHALHQSIIVIDTDGYIIEANRAWGELSASINIPSDFQWLGVNFLQIYDVLLHTCNYNCTIANQFYCIFNGQLPSFFHDFSMNINLTTEWFMLEVFPLIKNKKCIDGAVISISNITQRKQVEFDFQEAVLQIRTLRGLIPICAVCKRIKEDDLWSSIESFLEKHTYAEFTHDICPECIRRLYPKYSSVLDHPPDL